MNNVFKNSENSKTSDPHRLLFNLTDKINLKRSDKYVALSNLSIYYILDHAKESAGFETSSKRIIQKTAEGIGDLIGIKIANKIRNVSKNSKQIIQR